MGIIAPGINPTFRMISSTTEEIEVCGEKNRKDYGIAMFSLVAWIVPCSSSLMDDEEGRIIMTRLVLV